MHVPLEIVFVVMAIAAVLLFFNSRRKQPKVKTFRCARCSATAPHTARTLNAFREGKTKFFCAACRLPRGASLSDAIAIGTSCAVVDAVLIR
jgi:hypothetical protein